MTEIILFLLLGFLLGFIACHILVVRPQSAILEALEKDMFQEVMKEHEKISS